MSEPETPAPEALPPGLDPGTSAPAGDPPARSRSALRWAGVVLRWSLWSLLAAVVALVLFARTEAGQERIRRAVEEAANSAMQEGSVRVGSVGGSLLGLAEFGDVVVSDGSGRAVVSVPEVSIRFGLWELLRREVHVERLSIRGAAIEPRILDDGGIDLARLFRMSAPSDADAPLPVSLRVDQIAVSESRFVLRDARNQDARVLVVEDFALESALRLDRNGDLDLDISSLGCRAAVGGLTRFALPFALVSTSVMLRGERVDLIVSRFSVGQTSLFGFTGRLDLAAGGREPFKSVEIDLPKGVITPDVASAFVPGLELVEPITIKGSFGGPPERVEASVSVEGPGEPVVAAVAFDVTHPATPRYEGSLLVTRFDPARWVSGLPVSADLTARFGFDGVGITPRDLGLRAEIDMGPSWLAGVPVERIYGNIRVRGDSVELTQLEGAALGAEVTARGSASLGGAVELHLDARAPDLEAAEAFAPESLRPTRGTARVSVDIAGQVPVGEYAELLRLPPLELVRRLAPGIQADIDVDARGLAAGPHRLDRLRIEASKPPERDAKATLTATARGLTSGPVRDGRADLRIDVTGTSATLSLQADAGQLGRLAVEGGLDVLPERATLALRQFEAAAAGLTLRSREPATLVAELAPGYEPTAFSLDGLSIALQHGRLEASGRVDLAGPLDARLDATGVRLADLVGLARFVRPGVAFPEGELGFAVRVGGNAAAPTVAVTSRLAGLRHAGVGPYDVTLDAGYRPGDASSKLRISQSGAVIASFDASGPVTLDPATGRLWWSRTRPLAAAWRTEAVEVAPLLALVPGLGLGDPGAVIRTAGSVSGTLDSLQLRGEAFVTDLRATLMVEGREVRLDGLGADTSFAYVASGAGPPSFEGGAVVRWGSSALATAQVRLDADIRPLLEDPALAATWATTVKGEVAVEVPERELSSLPAPVVGLTGLRGGRLGAKARWSNHGIMPELALSLTGRGLERPPLEPVGFDVSVTSTDRTVASANLDYGDLRVASLEASIEARIDALVEPAVRATRAVALRVTTGALPVSLLAPLVPSMASLGGVAEGYVDVTGTVLAPRVTGRVAVRGIPMQPSGEVVAGIEFTASATHAAVDVITCGSSDGATPDATPLQARLEVCIPPGAWAGVLAGRGLPDVSGWPLMARVFAHETPVESLPTALLAGSAVSGLRGRFDADLLVGGTIASPVASGAVRLRDLGATFAALNRRLENVAADIRFEPERVRLERLEIAESSSSLTGRGEVVLSGVSPTNASLDLALRNFLVTDAKGSAVFVSGGVQVAGARAGEGWRATTTIRDSLVVVPEYAVSSTYGPTALSGDILFVGEDVEPAEVGKRNPARIDAGGSSGGGLPRIDVAVRTAGRNRVQHTYADLTYGIDLNVAIEGDDIRPVGSVTIPDGEVRFTGKVFKVTRGVLSFDGVGENPFDALVDVRATHPLSAKVAENLPESSSGTPSVSIAVSGTLSGPRIQFESDPALPQEDILFVLLTGRPLVREETTTGDAVSAQQQALSTAGNLFLGLLSDRLPGVGVDTLTIEGDTQTGRAVSRVEGGKYLTGDLFVSGTYIPQAREDENDFEVALDWIMVRWGADSLRMTLRGGNRGNGGLEMLYNLTAP